MKRKCELCSTLGRSVYHYAGCPLEKKEGVRIIFKNWDRPIEKADRYLMRSGMEREGAKGWI